LAVQNQVLGGPAKARKEVAEKSATKSAKSKALTMDQVPMHSMDYVPVNSLEQGPMH